MEKIFRYSIKAVIIRDGKLLVESCDYGRGRFCKLPGGGHQWGETMEQALIRECREELNLTVRPERLLFVRDYIAKNHDSPFDDPCFHQAELMFLCTVEDFSPLCNGSIPDGEKQQIRWIEIDRLADSDFFPQADDCPRRRQLSAGGVPAPVPHQQDSPSPPDIPPILCLSPH